MSASVTPGAPRRRGPAWVAPLVFAIAALAAAPALAEDAAAWLARAATAARTLNYTGTIFYQNGNVVEMSRLVHLAEGGQEFEKLVSLDGPAREVIRGAGEVRSFYPDVKLVRVEPRTFRNAFPSLSPQQQKVLAENYVFRKAETGRVAGMEAQAWVFEPRDGLRYGHKFWSDVATGIILKARLVNEKGDVIEQLAFTDLNLGAKVDREMVKPSWPPVPSDWQLRQIEAGDAEARDSGWVVGQLPPGFTKIAEQSYRVPRGKRQPVAHLVFSDGLVAISVFIEPMHVASYPMGLTQQGGLNVFIRQLDDHVITVLGEAPAATIRQIAASVARR